MNKPIAKRIETENYIYLQKMLLVSYVLSIQAAMKFFTAIE